MDGKLDLDAYLERIAYDGPRTVSAETLERLHEAHLGAIPFENLEILLGHPVLLTLEALEKKIVQSRRGGYCFEQNTLFRAALEAIGFTVTSLAARVRMGTTIVRPRTHMLLRVDIDGTAYMADVGFGGDGLPQPLPLEAGAETERHRLVRETPEEGDESRTLWVLKGKPPHGETGEWIDLYAFTLEPQYPVDFEMANHFTSTYPESPFVQGLTAQRILPDRRIILRNRDFEILGAGARKETVRDPDHLLELLRDHFDLHFPAGTTFSLGKPGSS